MIEDVAMKLVVTSAKMKKFVIIAHLLIILVLYATIINAVQMKQTVAIFTIFATAASILRQETMEYLMMQGFQFILIDHSNHQ